MNNLILADLLSGNDPNALPNDPFESVDRTLTRYDEIGASAPKPSTSISLLEGFGKVLNYPGNVMRSALYGSSWNDIGQAILGEKQFNTRDVLTNMGMQDGLGKTLLGFAGDVVTDPLTFMGSGLFGKGAGMALDSGLASRIAAESAGEAAAKTLTETRSSISAIEDALKGFVNPVERNMDSLSAARTAMGGDAVTGESLLGLQQRTRNALNVAEEGVTTADRDLGSLLSNPMSGITGKNVLKTRNTLVDGLTTGKLTGTNSFVDDPMTSFVDIYKRVKSATGQDLTGSQIGTLMKLYRTDAPQLHTLVNITDTFKTQVKDLDSAFNMAKKFADTDYVDDVVKANEALFGATKVRDAANIRAVFTNNLVTEIDKLGMRRYWGIMSPTGKAILPLADITPVAEKVGQVADKAYLNIPGYKAFSDWFRQSITGDFTREAYMKGGDFINQLQEGKGIIQSFNLAKQISPHLGAEFIQNVFGKEVLESDPRLLIGAVYGSERNIVRDVAHADGSMITVKDPYTAYIWGSIADDVGDTAVSAAELAEARAYIATTHGEEGLRHIDDTIINPFLARGGKLTPDEIATAKGYSENARVSTDVLFQHEQLQGSPLTDTDYNPWYIYHMYDTEPAVMGAKSSRSQRMINTNTGLKAAKEREYITIGEAIADDLELKPVDNLVELMGARFNMSLRYGMNRGLIKGIDDLFAGQMQNVVRKVIKDKELDYAAAKTPEELARVQNLQKTAQVTSDVLVKTLGGKNGLKELGQVIKPAKFMTKKELNSGKWTPIDSVFGLTRAGGSNSVYYVHKDLLPHVENLARPIASSEGMRQLLDWTDNATRFIKTIQTTLSPTFAVRNYAGEATMSFLNGTSMDAVKDAGNILKTITNTTEMNGKSMYMREALSRLKVMRPDDTVTMGGKTLTAKEATEQLKLSNKINVNGKDMTIQEVYDSAVRNGLISSGHTSEYALSEQDRVAQMLRGASAKEKAKNAYKNTVDQGGKFSKARGLGNAGIAAAEHAANKGDALFRLGDYIHNLREGMTEAQAAARVKTFHVDYNDLTQFEKGFMRRIVPYYTFMRHNIPIQLRLMIERPAYYSTLGKLINNSNAALGDPATPDYLKKGLAVPIYKDDNGNTHYLNWNLPLTDLSKFRIDSPAETAKQFMQTLNPLIKAPFELATGHNIAFQSPVKPVDYLSSQLGGVTTAGKAISEAMTPDAQFEGQYAKPKQVPLVGGMLPTVNPQKEELSRAYAYREQLLADMQERKKEGQPIPELPAIPQGLYPNKTLLGITPYTIDPNYWKNKDYVRRNGNMFTP